MFKSNPWPVRQIVPLLIAHLSLQILLCRDRHRPVLPAQPRRHLPRPQAGQRAPRPGRTYQDRRLRHVQGEDRGGRDHQDLLRDSRLHCARGEKRRIVSIPRFSNFVFVPFFRSSTTSRTTSPWTGGRTASSSTRCWWASRRSTERTRRSSSGPSPTTTSPTPRHCPGRQRRSAKR